MIGVRGENPRVSNTGVTFGSGGVRFDWYAATFDESRGGEFVATSLAFSVGASLSRVRGRFGYALGFAVERDGVELALVLFGAAGGAEVHVEIPGAGCDELVSVLRGRWPLHRVSRVDAAVDFVGDFEVVDAAVMGAVGHRVKHELRTNSEGGVTRYLGSRKSAVFVRVYKKTEELRAKYGAAVDVPDGIVRVEAEVRPHSRDKGAFAFLSPAEVMGYRAISRDVAGVVVPGSVVRWDGEPVHKRPTSWERGVEALCHQYGPMSREHAEQVGADAVLREIGVKMGLVDA